MPYNANIELTLIMLCHLTVVNFIYAIYQALFSFILDQILV